MRTNTTPRGAWVTHRMLYDQIRDQGIEIDKLRRENEKLLAEVGRLEREQDALVAQEET